MLGRAETPEDTVDPRSCVSDGSAVLKEQLESIDRWIALRLADQTGLVPVRDASRDQQQDLRTRAVALDVEAEALRLQCTRAEHQPRPPRAVLVHRDAWLTGKVADGLTRVGVDIVATAVDGAVGCGIAIAEAPELVLLEAGLPHMPGVEVTRRVLRCSPRTLVTARVSHAAQAQALLDAGVAAAWTRRVPPADLVQALCALLS